VRARLKPEELPQWFLRWRQAVSEVTHGEVVAIEGKTLRRSFARATGKRAIPLGSAWASATRVGLGQPHVDEKSNEITASPALLRLVDLKGCSVTSDAMGCQKAIARTSVEQEAAYVLPLVTAQRGRARLSRLRFSDRQHANDAGTSAAKRD
jgi:hypothetical protein